MPVQVRGNAIVGNDVQLGCLFQFGSTPTNPFNVNKVEIIDTDGVTVLETILLAAMTHPSAGVYYATAAAVNIDAVGMYRDKWYFTWLTGEAEQTVIQDFYVSTTAAPSVDSLGLGYLDFVRVLGRYLYGAPIAVGLLTAVQLADIEDMIREGLRAFYFPLPSNPKEAPHQWSFLRPVTTLTTGSGDYDQDAPADFAALTGGDRMTYAVGLGYGPITKVPESRIRELRQNSTLTGQPRFVAVRPKTTTGGAAQRWEFVFYPTPDAAYVLTYRYQIMPGTITQAAPYPYGGTQHAQTALQSCLARAELMKNADPGPHQEMFHRMLAASIALDKGAAPDFFGYNGDWSGVSENPENRTLYATYEGVLPT